MGKAGEELFEIVDEEDRVVGQATRSQCHGNPSLIHRVVHILVFNRHGDVLLQKRSRNKDIQPGRWDTSVGGHLEPGEDYFLAALREGREELGLVNPSLTFLYNSKIRNLVESENVGTFLTFSEGPFDYDRKEIDELKFWSRGSVSRNIDKGIFTPNFEEEWKLFSQWTLAHGFTAFPGK